MIKHVVIFRLKSSLTTEEQQIVFTTFRKAILALPPHIPQIQSIEVYYNINEKEGATLLLDSSFKTLADVETYATHPLHVEVAQYLRPNVEARLCVDTEI